MSDKFLIHGFTFPIFHIFVCCGSWPWDHWTSIDHLLSIHSRTGSLCPLFFQMSPSHRCSFYSWLSTLAREYQGTVCWILLVIVCWCSFLSEYTNVWGKIVDSEEHFGCIWVMSMVYVPFFPTRIPIFPCCWGMSVEWRPRLTPWESQTDFCWFCASSRYRTPPPMVQVGRWTRWRSCHSMILQQLSSLHRCLGVMTLTAFERHVWVSVTSTMTSSWHLLLYMLSRMALLVVFHCVFSDSGMLSLAFSHNLLHFTSSLLSLSWSAMRYVVHILLPSSELLYLRSSDLVMNLCLG